MDKGPSREVLRGILELPILWTFHDPSAIVQGVPKDQLLEFKDGYSQERLSALVVALDWAASNPQEDLAAIIPNVEYSNQEIHQYLTLLHEQFSEKQSEWYPTSQQVAEEVPPKQ